MESAGTTSVPPPRPLLGGPLGGWGSPRWSHSFVFFMRSCPQPPGPSAPLLPSRSPFGFYAQRSLDPHFYSQPPLFLHCSQNTSLITEVQQTLGDLTELSETSGTNTQNSGRKKSFPWEPHKTNRVMFIDFALDGMHSPGRSPISFRLASFISVPHTRQRLF